jgi:hypothetical protein
MICGTQYWVIGLPPNGSCLARRDTEVVLALFKPEIEQSAEVSQIHIGGVTDF